LSHLLSPGVYPPVPTFFNNQEELDLATLCQHIQRLAGSGIAGYVLMGSNGEAVHLTPDERIRLISLAHEMIEDLPGHLTLVAGCGEQSARATIANCQRAAQHGADFALVLPPFYYRGLMSSAVLLTYYHAVADASPMPIVIYNMPANAAGLDLDAATLLALAEHPNIVGVKDSVGNIAKLAQIIEHAPPSFQVFAGSAGYFLPALAVGACGVVAALANIYPRAVCRVQQLFAEGQLVEARHLQARIVPVNAAVTTRFGVPGLKAALDLTAGYGGHPRLPLSPLDAPSRDELRSLLERAHLEVEEDL
jgi:dihydrodipicolinate synthase/N-acetylneuraminate lyase